MKTLSTIIATIAALMIAALAGRYVSGHWIFFAFASFQIQVAALACLVAAFAWLLHRCW